MKVKFLAFPEMASECHRLGIDSIRCQFIIHHKEVYGIPWVDFILKLTAAKEGTILYLDKLWEGDFTSALSDERKTAIEARRTTLKEKVIQTFSKEGIDIIQGGVIEEP